uniref:Uncharacterized protein n=1 Tax=Lotharella oceanica TaxID=641309 RepID=A0A7S2XGI6_9EUKA
MDRHAAGEGMLGRAGPPSSAMNRRGRIRRLPLSEIDLSNIFEAMSVGGVKRPRIESKNNIGGEDMKAAVKRIHKPLWELRDPQRSCNRKRKYIDYVGPTEGRERQCFPILHHAIRDIILHGISSFLNRHEIWALVASSKQFLFLRYCLMPKVIHDSSAGGTREVVMSTDECLSRSDEPSAMPTEPVESVDDAHTRMTKRGRDAKTSIEVMAGLFAMSPPPYLQEPRFVAASCLSPRTVQCLVSQPAPMEEGGVV